MEHVRISAIAAIGKNRELGAGNELIWKIPEDFERMKNLTNGHTLIMGRKTHESIGRPLPKRTNIIVTRDTNYTSEGCIVTHSLAEALEAAKEAEKDNEEKEIFIFGGAQIYMEALPFTQRLYLTYIDAEAPDADSFFPPYDDFKNVLEEERHESNGLIFTFLTLERSI